MVEFFQEYCILKYIQYMQYSRSQRSDNNHPVQSCVQLGCNDSEKSQCWEGERRVGRERRLIPLMFVKGTHFVTGEQMIGIQYLKQLHIIIIMIGVLGHDSAL